MKKTSKRLTAAVLCCVFAASSLLFGCKKIEPVSKIEGSSQSSEESGSQQADLPDQNLNPLTGRYDLKDSMVNKRPVSIMINNAHAAWPQKSISNADIIYELPVEGGLTRLMAVYADYTKSETFGSVRSVRHDFVELSMPLNTVFIHWGGSASGYDALRNYNIDDIDGMIYGNTYFYTDKTLQKSVEHCRFMTQQNITDAITNLEIPKDGGISAAYHFYDGETPLTFSDTEAVKATVKVSGEVTVEYQYDAASGKYQKSEFGEVTPDGNTGQPVLIDNVFILYSRVDLMADGVHKDIHLTNGTGYYLTKGTKTKINWSKGDADAPMKYQLESGEELSVNPGNSWVLFAPNSAQSSTTFSAS